MYEGVYSDDPMQDELAIEFWGRYERFAGTGDDPNGEEYLYLTEEEIAQATYELLARWLRPYPAGYGHDDIPF